MIYTFTLLCYLHDFKPYALFLVCFFNYYYYFHPSENLQRLPWVMTDTQPSQQSVHVATEIISKRFTT